MVIPEIEREIVQAVTTKGTGAKAAVATKAKAVGAAGLEKEALRELAMVKAATGAKVAAGTKVAVVGKGSIMADPINTATAVQSVAGTKTISLGLGLGLGIWGPILLTGGIGIGAYYLWKNYKKDVELQDDEGFYPETVNQT